MMSDILKTIAVDLTPILPGGENGGAKIFILELLRQLSKSAPATQFVLLTQAASHEELATLDAPNMRRVMIINPSIKALGYGTLLRRCVSRMMVYMPMRMKHYCIRVGTRLLKNNQSSPSLLKAMGVDLLFCPLTSPTYSEPGIPVVCTIYDLQYRAFPQFFAVEDAAHRDYAFVEACKRATALVAISNYSRDETVKYSPVRLRPFHGERDELECSEGLSPLPQQAAIKPEISYGVGDDLKGGATIRTIYLRMSQRISDPIEQDKAVLSRLMLHSQRYFIYPANFWKHKNHEMLFTAFSMACQSELPEDMKLVCTGAAGARHAWLIEVARAMGFADRIILPGFLPQSEMAVLMDCAVGMIYPSLFEGFGLPIIEAMAMGVPVACSALTSLPEIAADAALLFDPRIPTQIAKSMVSLVQDETLRAKLIAAGRQRAIEFSDSKRMATDYLEVFKSALQKEDLPRRLSGLDISGTHEVAI